MILCCIFNAGPNRRQKYIQLHERAINQIENVGTSTFLVFHSCMATYKRQNGRHLNKIKYAFVVVPSCFHSSCCILHGLWHYCKDKISRHRDRYAENACRRPQKCSCGSSCHSNCPRFFMMSHTHRLTWCKPCQRHCHGRLKSWELTLPYTEMIRLVV